MNLRFVAISALCAPLALACATTKPCSKAGDTTWANPAKPIRGNMECFQKDLPDGHRVNHGLFRQFYENGKVALTGEFVDGKRNGVWTQYDEKGEPIMRRKFENGVEVSAATLGGTP